MSSSAQIVLNHMYKTYELSGGGTLSIICEALLPNEKVLKVRYSFCNDLNL